MFKSIEISSVKKRILWTCLMSSIAVLFVLAVQRKLNADVNTLVVKIKPIKGNRNLISENDVASLFTKYIGYDVRRRNVKDVEIGELEALLKADKRIKKVELFMDSDNKLNVWIVQKQPVVRVMDGANKSYYIDEEGDQVPVVNQSAIRVPLATGHFELYQEEIFKSDKPSKLKDLFIITKFIAKDPFLEALIEQVDVSESGDVVLIPKIGRQEIIVGDAVNLEDKFENLKIMYKEGLPREGWRKFSVLKLNFKGQVVAEKNKHTENSLTNY
jgi:cell division protein FtsQ